MKPSFRSSFTRLLQLHQFDICVLLETRLSGPSLQRFRRRISRCWNSYAVESNGLSGGILALWREPSIRIDAFHSCTQQVALVISEGITPPWLLLGIYASTDYRERRSLWSEILTLLGQGFPTLIAGDFNCIVDASEKRGGRRFVDSPNSCEFRSFISTARVVDLGFSGSRFTWCNNRRGSARVWERLDRALASPDWMQIFSGATISHLPRIASDHCPLLISTKLSTRSLRPFRFEQFWTSYSSARAIIRQVWRMPVRGSSAYRLSRRLELVRRRLLRWNRREVGNITQRIQSVEADIALLQAREDSDGCLSEIDLQSLRYSLSLHHSLLSQQETYWRQRSRIQWLQEGDRNTRFFHQATVARRAANRIRYIRDENGYVVEDDETIREQIVHYFQSRWTDVSASGIPCSPVLPSAWVSEGDNAVLLREVSAEEIRSAVWDLGPDKAPGPDGFPPFFFRHYWDIVGLDVVMAIQTVFSTRVLPPDWQRTFVSLIPKRSTASLPQHYRPISLCTTLYKICARLLVTRLQRVIPRLISLEQGAFIRGRSITDNALIAQEFMHDLYRAPGRRALMAVQLDMERAYDRISWTFLRQTLREFRFADLFIDWVMACVQGPTFSILINGTPSGFFHSAGGLRQGCPLSPFLFVLCADDLSRSFAHAVGASTLQPYMPGPQGPPLSHLLFADDCILLSPASTQNAMVSSAILQAYCQASGQRINLQKSVLCFSPSITARRRTAISHLLGISSYSDHLSYLGIPITGRRPRQSDFGDLDRRISDRLGRWQASSLSMMGRIMLIRSILTSLPLYLLSNSLIPVICLRRIERRFRDFLWGSRQGGHGIHLLSWDIVCLPIREGGLGIQSLVLRRQALIARHASRFLLDPHCFWSIVMRGRYGGWSSDSISHIPRGCSLLWRAICQVAPSIMTDIHWMIGDGRSVDITQDSWIAAIPLSRWPTFLSTAVDPSMPVSSLICQDSNVWNVSAISRLFGTELAQRILDIPLAPSPVSDTRLWRRSCLSRAPTRDLVDCFRTRILGLSDVVWIWRLPVHPRIRLFLWKLQWNRLPTCALLVGRGLPISPLCPICGLEEETVDHVIFTCSRARLIWRQMQFIPWLTQTGPIRLSFLHAIRSGAQSGPGSQGATFAYLAYHLWLTRNQMVFSEETVPPQAIIRTAVCLAKEYGRSTYGDHFARPGLWDSLAAPAAHRSTVYVSWEPPPPGYVKVNFDGSVSDRVAGSGFVIRGSEGELIAAGGHGSLDISVPMAELQAAWAGISYAVRHLASSRLIIEGDSLTVVRWIRRDRDLQSTNPLLHDIWNSLRSTAEHRTRHVFREANAAADWIASVAARHPGTWEWHIGDPCPLILRQILYSDLSGLTHARLV